MSDFADDQIVQNDLLGISHIPVFKRSFVSIAVNVSLNILSGVILLPLVVYFGVCRPLDILEILKKALCTSIKFESTYQDPVLIQKVLDSVVAKAYIKGGLEYQLREGYCSSATIRCMLKSIPALSVESVPLVEGGSSIPSIVRGKIDSAAKGLTRSTVVYGSEGYNIFQSQLRKVNSARYRVCVNFLRSPMFGVLTPSWAPFHWLLVLFGGHFSPVIAYLEEEDLVAIFDVNHTYNGIYLVRSQRLFDAINTPDLSVGKRTVRGLIVTELLDS
jgi:hypothetical protein